MLLGLPYLSDVDEIKAWTVWATIYRDNLLKGRNIYLERVAIPKLEICPIYCEDRQYNMMRVYRDIILDENVILLATH
jgi:hypothetical protein